MSYKSHIQVVDSAKLFFSVAEVAKLCGISRKSVYRQLERGRLTASSALRKKLIPRASLFALVDEALQGGHQ